MEWSSQEIYKGMLMADETVKDHTIYDLSVNTKPDIPPTILLFIDTSNCYMYESEKGMNLINSLAYLVNTTQPYLQDMNKSKYNVGEAGLVKILVEELKELDVKAEDIGVILLIYNSSRLSHLIQLKSNA